MTQREGAERIYRDVLTRRIERNRRRLLHGQDGRGNALTPEQRHALAVALTADDCDWFRSWVQEVAL